MLPKTSHTNSMKEKPGNSWGGESFSPRIPTSGKILEQLDAEGGQPHGGLAASREESWQGPWRKDLCYEKPVSQTLGNLGICSIWTQECELASSLFWHKCLNITPIHMNHGFAEGAAGKMMATSSPTVTCLCSTVLEETNLTLSFERAEKTIHSCASFPLKGVITVWWRLEVHGCGVGSGSEQNPRPKWRVLRKVPHLPWMLTSHGLGLFSLSLSSFGPYPLPSSPCRNSTLGLSPALLPFGVPLELGSWSTQWSCLPLTFHLQPTGSPVPFPCGIVSFLPVTAKDPLINILYFSSWPC